MISLTTALEGVYTLWPRDAEPRKVAAIDFVTGNHQNVLRPGELLRSIHLPAKALSKRFAFRRASLTHLGRSAIIVIGTQSPGGCDLLLTVTAATVRPVQLRFDRVPSTSALREALDAAIPDADYFDDVHGAAHYKRHLTYYFAEQIRAELGKERRDELLHQRQDNLGRAGSWPVPAYLSARPGMLRRQERLRCRATAGRAQFGSTARRSTVA